jgi:hypothetical protein
MQRQARLSTLDPVEYAIGRKAAAARLGIPVATLDPLVTAECRKAAKDAEARAKAAKDAEAAAAPEPSAAPPDPAEGLGRIGMADLPPDPAAADAAEIARLATLKPLDYGRERKAAADRLGCPVAILDRAVAAERGKGYNSGAGQGRALDLPEPEPWPGPVDGAALLDGPAAAIQP